MSNLSRRNFLRLSGVTALSLAVPAVSAIPATAAPRFPGHQPGRIYLGMSTNLNLANIEREYSQMGLRRTFYRWNELSRERKQITRDHSQQRLPWVSFKPPGTRQGWAKIAQGAYDKDIRARARHYAAMKSPVITTFHHEPQGETYYGSPRDWARAYIRIHDVMKNETGLRNVTLAPIIGDWVFDPKNRRDDPGDFLIWGVLNRMSLLGTDIYQNPSGQAYDVRMGRTMDWLDSRGFRNIMLGVGETGATDEFGSPNGATWWRRSWNFAVSNRDRVAAISYFNSTKGHKGVDVALNESWSKKKAYKDSLSSWTACTL